MLVKTIMKTKRKKKTRIVPGKTISGAYFFLLFLLQNIEMNTN